MRAQLTAIVLLSSAAAHAQEAPVATAVTTAADSVKLGLEFRSELNHHDHGLKKVDGKPDPEATSTLEVQSLKIKLSGKINPKTEFKFRFNFLNPKNGIMDYGYGTHWLTDSFGFAIGRQKVLQGGWDNYDNGFRDHAQGIYAKNFAFSKYDDMISLQLKMAGKIQIQILNDVEGDYNKNAHQTFAVGWMGNFGGVSPLISVGTYDNQKSHWIDVGMKAELSGAEIVADVSQHTIGVKDEDAAGKTKDLQDIATTVTLKAAYSVAGVVRPNVYYSVYENKQDGVDDSAASDQKVNSPEFDDKTPPAPTGKYLWDDNGTTYAVGLDLLAFGKGWTPYLAYVGNSGKFPKGIDMSTKETKSESQIKLGVLGEF